MASLMAERDLHVVGSENIEFGTGSEALALVGGFKLHLEELAKHGISLRKKYSCGIYL